MYDTLRWKRKLAIYQIFFATDITLLPLIPNPYYYNFRALDIVIHKPISRKWRARAFQTEIKTVFRKWYKVLMLFEVYYAQNFFINKLEEVGKIIKKQSLCVYVKEHLKIISTCRVDLLLIQRHWIKNYI